MCKTAMIAIRNLAVGHLCVEALRSGVCEGILPAYLHACMHHAWVVALMISLNQHFSSPCHFCLCANVPVAEVVAVLRSHGPTSAAMCEQCMEAIINLAREDASRAPLRDAGVCEGSLAHSMMYSCSFLLHSNFNEILLKRRNIGLISL